MPKTHEQLIKDMTACEQTKGISVLEHGFFVRCYFTDLIDHLRDGDQLEYQWKLPEWLTTHKEFILSKLFDDEILKSYQEFHDCGKPYCKIMDDNGKHHFPNHANVSYDVWNSLHPDDKIVANLIKSDMDIHCLKSEQVDEFAQRPEAISLLLTGLSEIHANASMFGGIESISFKIKWKQIDKRGKQILSKIMGA